ncbi:MAG: hypothetical protein A2016_01705 [Elusimicrobia bacterium GWF2_62_30]|nr:MAG: hypothetical protein A2016_01705 [Elusimicrobia bacterium GWF2_62_30]
MPDPEREQRPAPAQQQERKPMLAPKSDMRHSAGLLPRNLAGLAAAAVLTAGLAAALVFRGNVNPGPPAPQPQQTQAAEMAPAPAAAPADNTLPAVPVVRTIGAQAVDRKQIERMVAELNNRAMDAIKKAAPNAKFTSVPSGWPAGATPNMAALAPVDCPGCADGLDGAKGQANTLPTGTYFIDAKYDRTGIKQNFMGLCDGKYMYEIKNPAAKARQISIITQQGETWNFRLGPGKSNTVKSSTEFIGGSYSLTWK